MDEHSVNLSARTKSVEQKPLGRAGEVSDVSPLDFMYNPPKCTSHDAFSTDIHSVGEVSSGCTAALDTLHPFC